MRNHGCSTTLASGVSASFPVQPGLIEPRYFPESVTSRHQNDQRGGGERTPYSIVSDSAPFGSGSAAAASVASGSRRAKLQAHMRPIRPNPITPTFKRLLISALLQ